MKTRLTKRIIDAQPLPASGRAILRDSEVTNLTLVVFPSGKKTWYLYYRTEERTQRNAKIGSYPALGVDAARTLALQWTADVSRGADPAAVRKAKVGQKTVNDLAEWFLSEHVQQKLKPTTQAEYQRILDKHIMPALGKTRLDAVTPEMVRRFHQRMSGTPRQANLTMAILHRMFNDAMHLGWRTTPLNPVSGIRKFKENQRTRYLNAAEFKRLWKVLAIEAGEETKRDGVLALRLLALTGRRKSEILNLTWNELDLVEGRMMLSDSKVGAREYRLAEGVVRLLKEAQLARNAGSTTKTKPANASGAQIVNPFVIRGRHGKGRLVALQKIWQRVRRKAGLDDVRLHDLRHSYASMAIEKKADLIHVKELLGHRDIATTQRYTHLYTESIRATVGSVEAGIMEAVEADLVRQLTSPALRSPTPQRSRRHNVTYGVAMGILPALIE